jgi:hypothetical protein
MKKKHQIKLCTNHNAIRVAPPDLDELLRRSEHAPDPALIRAIEYSLKRKLLTCGPESRLQISAIGIRRTQFVLQRVGDTALVAGVLRGNDSALESLTVCRAGLDNAEDDTALDVAGEFMIKHDDRPGAREHVEGLFDTVRQHQKPHAVHIHFDEESYKDLSVRIVTHSLAESFFDLFGMEKLHHATDV